MRIDSPDSKVRLITANTSRALRNQEMAIYL
jgi:hypothetical protein